MKTLIVLILLLSANVFAQNVPTPLDQDAQLPDYADATDSPPLPPTGGVLNSEGCLSWDLHWNYAKGVVWNAISSADQFPGPGDTCLGCAITHNKVLFDVPARPLSAKYYIYLNACRYTMQSECSAYVFEGMAYPQWTLCFADEPIDPSIDPETVTVPYAVKENPEGSE